MEERKTTFMLRELLAGAGIGLLVGLLVGLSVSEVVGGVIGSLTALLAAFFGLGGKLKTKGANEKVLSETTLEAWRAVAFGFVCSGAILGGLAIRTQNLLSPTPRNLVQVWVDAGFPKEIARDLVAYQTIGLVPKDRETVSPERTVARVGSVLFATEATSECPNLISTSFSSPEERAKAFGLAGGGWEAVAKAVEGLETDRTTAVLDSAWQLVCGESE